MPRIRADIVDVYVFRRVPEGAEFLQMFREDGGLARTWQPVMGHIEDGESALAAAVREMAEETGLRRDEALGMWALEQMHPFYIARTDEVVLSPRFAVEVAGGEGEKWEPRLNEEHSSHRWIAGHQADRFFMWPGQRAAVREVLEVVVKGGLGEAGMRVE